MKKFNVDGHEPSLLPDNMNFKLVWSDEFDGTKLDTSKWSYETGSGHNNEKQYYTKDNVSVSDGTLKITADGTVKDVAPLLPRFGLEFILKEENEKLKRREESFKSKNIDKNISFLVIRSIDRK